MQDPTGFMINTTKLSALSKSSRERGGGLLNCTNLGTGTGMGTIILEKLGHNKSGVRLLINYLIFILCII